MNVNIGSGIGTRAPWAGALAIALLSSCGATRCLAQEVVKSDSVEGAPCGTKRSAVLKQGTYQLDLSVFGDCPLRADFTGLDEPALHQPLPSPLVKKKGTSRFKLRFLVTESGELAFTCEGHDEKARCGFSYSITRAAPGSGTTAPPPVAASGPTPPPSETPGTPATPTPTSGATPATDKAPACASAARTISYQGGAQLFVLSVKSDSQCESRLKATTLNDLNALVGQSFPHDTTLIRLIRVPTPEGGTVEIDCGDDTEKTCDYEVKPDQVKAEAGGKVDGDCESSDTLIQLDLVGEMAVLPAGFYSLRVERDSTSDCVPVVTAEGPGGTLSFAVPHEGSVNELRVPKGSTPCRFQLAQGTYKIHIKCAPEGEGKKCKYSWQLSAMKKQKGKAGSKPKNP